MLSNDLDIFKISRDASSVSHCDSLHPSKRFLSEFHTSKLICVYETQIKKSLSVRVGLGLSLYNPSLADRIYKKESIMYGGSDSSSGMPQCKILANVMTYSSK